MKILNKKINFNYELIEEYITGIKLIGSEVKSIKKKKINFTESFCHIQNQEIFIKNFYINKYKYDNTNKFYNPNRNKKLLLKKHEIKKIKKKLIKTGYTLIPRKIFLNKQGFIKLQIFICKGKKIHDKRNLKKKKDILRECKKNIKYNINKIK